MSEARTNEYEAVSTSMEKVEPRFAHDPKDILGSAGEPVAPDRLGWRTLLDRPGRARPAVQPAIQRVNLERAI